MFWWQLTSGLNLILALWLAMDGGEYDRAIVHALIAIGAALLVIGRGGNRTTKGGN